MSFGPHVARVGDMGVGTCPFHQSPVQYTTILVSGASFVTADGLQVAIVGSVGVSSCGHPTIALAGASFAQANGQKIHRQGDVGVNYGEYVVVTSSPTTDAI